MIDQQPVQLISSIERFELPLQDLSSLPPQQRQAEIVERCRLEAERPFDLSDDLLLRAALLRLSGDEHVLLLTMHHIASDGWSLQVLWREVQLLYDAYRQDTDPDLAALPVQYADYALWQRGELQGGRLEQLLHYWREQLQGLSPLELPADHPRPAVPSYRGAQHDFELNELLVDQLRALSQAAGVTQQMTLLAAFEVLLSRYSGQHDIAVGVPIAGRNQTELEHLIGFFVNTLVLRTDLSGDPSFAELLVRVRATSLDAYDHQDLPFERLVEELQPERELSRSPLVQVLFQLLSFSDQDLTLADLEVNRQPSSSQRVRFDLEMHLWQTGKKLRGELTYATDLFDAATIERMVGHFVTLLEAIVADPDQRISELPLLTESERRQLLIEWNDTAVDYPSDSCVQQLFEQQVAKTPDAVAVVFEDQQLSYRQLNARANQLAHQLRTLGVGPETLVGLCLERSPELIVGILGILKAGGAYLPLDADYPQARLQFMLGDANVEFLVTEQPLLDRLPASGCQVICLDTDLARLRQLPASNPELNFAADNLAYVMYTSGSTGLPKGVAIEHRSIARLVFGNDYTAFGPDRVFLQLATPSFDASTLELWGALLHGSKLVVAPVAVPDFRQLENLLQQHHVTTLWLTATLLNQLVEQYPQALRDVAEILTGGEALSVPHICQAQAALGPAVQLINGYGPTESTTFTTCYRIPPHIEPQLSSIPIGRPIANTQAYLLDSGRNPVPIGVPGELYIGGAGLARGYLNRPQLTAERFVANPFSEDPAARLYRTGDRCRWRADGNLEFLGRLDDQVKLRGYRIELGEIEAALNAHPDVAHSAVVLREDRPGDRRLVAYCVSAADTELSFPELRSHLVARLPDYMVPSALVVLDTLPLTSNGKLDRRALPAPEDFRPQLDTGYVAPRDPVEQQLVSIWCEVLELEAVGVQDNFFALGGHSLLAMRLHARITSLWQIDLPLRRLFEAPTIAELASEIKPLRGGGVLSSSTTLTRVDRDQLDHLPLSFSQQRLWFLEQMEPELTAYNMPYAWMLRGPLDPEALRRALEEVVRRHEPLRTSFTMIDQQPVQLISSIERFELPLQDLSSLPPQQRQAEIVERCRLEAERPFDLSDDLLLRAALLRLSGDEHVLLLTMHHIASDGWSLTVLWREVELLYDAYRQDTDPDLAALPVQYADYALWQRGELQGGRLEQLLHYWREQLQGLSPLELPADHPRPAVPSYRGAQHDFELNEPLVDQLRGLSQAAGVTQQMTLLAAFEVLLSRYSGQHDIAVGVPIAGRNHTDLENLIGFFVNTLVLRTDLSGDPSFAELLVRVRATSLDAYDHQDLPFERLVEGLQPERELSRSPLVQVLFQLLSFSDQDLALADLEIKRQPSSSQRVRFDLEMHLWPTGKQLRGSVLYSTDLFDPETIERMVGHFLTLLEAIVADADQPISELPLLAADERQQLLIEWNDTVVDYPSDSCVHELFEHQVERTPDAVAVVFEDQQLTYRQLNERANQLAHHLRSLGVGPETLVGLCLERSAELVIGILGILKAGGAYLPLDADYPQARLDFMLRDAAVEYLVTQQPLLDRVPTNSCRVICLDSELGKLNQCDRSNPSVAVAANNLAYVIYTSGSTGQPKGVQIPHEAVVNFLSAMAVQPGLTSADRLLSVTTPTFDISALELLLPLTVGACVKVLSSELVSDAKGLAAQLSKSAATTMQATPATWQMLIHSGWDGCQGLKVLCGGEALPDSLAQELCLRCGEVWNLYGPTETTIWSTMFRVTNGNTQGSIGRPIANTQVYVLDAGRNPVPIGVPGELYIGGTGLARGYLNRPKLTTERFVANPFSDDPSARLYRTGDRCRWRADGNLEFLGRLDDQVKLRGFRIELGEIESVLNEHRDVAHSVVVLREDRPGDKRLVAYFVAASDTTLSFPELRRYLASRLPDYMLPAAMVVLDSLPLTSSGKIDRRSLPVPDDSRPNWKPASLLRATRSNSNLPPFGVRCWGSKRWGFTTTSLRSVAIPCADCS